MKKLAILISLILIFSLAACSTSGGSTGSSTTGSQTSSSSTTSQSVDTTTAVTVASTPATSVADALAENKSSHEDASDLTWDASSVIQVTLNGDSIEASGAGVSVDGTTVTITAAGAYQFSGSLKDGQIIVDYASEDTTQLILAGADLHSSTSAPIFVKAAGEVVLVLADGTTNRVSDGTNYVYPSADTNEPNAAIFSMSDLTIFGSGSLMVEANFNDGITSKDGLVISSGTLSVTAVDDGIRGKDYLVVEGGSLTIQAGGDGLVSDNEEDVTKGYTSIKAGEINITSGGDAIQAQTDALISGGTFTLTTGGGSSGQISDVVSAKGIKGVVSVEIDGGTYAINSADDAIHSNDSVVINAGTFEISTGDDAIHADTSITINNGSYTITKSYEGIESATITINGGEFNIVSSDDGLNIAGGNDSSGMTFGGQPGGRPDAFGSSGKTLYINGGYIVVDAYGDGIDVNGSVEMTGGTLLVSGPVENNNGALDYDGTFIISGGVVVAAGSSGMAMAPDQNSSQNSLIVFLNSNLQAGTEFSVQNSAGEKIIAFVPTHPYTSIAVSSPDLVSGQTYTLYAGGSQISSVTISNTVTQVGTGGGGFGGGGGTRPGGGGTRPRP